MAATCREIVTRALHMIAVVPRGEDPEAAELADGMAVLQSLYDGWLIAGMFGRLIDVYESGDYEAGEGQRIYLSSGTVTLPTEVDERKPRDLVAVEFFDTDGRKAYVWDRTAWVQITDLEAADTAPLSERGANGLAACVAVAFAEEFGAPVTNAAMMQCRNFKTALSYKLGSEREVSTGTYY